MCSHSFENFFQKEENESGILRSGTRELSVVPSHHVLSDSQMHGASWRTSKLKLSLRKNYTSFRGNRFEKLILGTIDLVFFSPDKKTLLFAADYLYYIWHTKRPRSNHAGSLLKSVKKTLEDIRLTSEWHEGKTKPTLDPLIHSIRGSAKRNEKNAFPGSFRFLSDAYTHKNILIT